MTGINLNAGAGGLHPSPPSTQKNDPADQLAFERAIGSADQPPVNKRMNALRAERQQLEKDKQWLEERLTYGAYDRDRMNAEVKPKLDKVNLRIKENEAEQTALAEGMKANRIDERDEVCEVKLHMQRLHGQDWPFYHSFVTASDNDSMFFGRTGTPSYPFGPLVAETGPYQPGAKDWDTGPLTVVDVGKEEGDCAEIEDSFKRTGKRINDADHDYNLWLWPQNCHVGSTEFLNGIGMKVPDQDLPGLNPGLDKLLPRDSK